jgi:hypothetical protein
VLTDLSCSLGRWLLILDNCTDERLADSWVPRAGNGHVIVTTLNSASTPHGDTRIEVGGMSPAQAVELVRRRIEAAEEPSGPEPGLPARLARDLEGWPLALELACAYLRNGYGAEGIPEYLERMKRASLSDPEAVPRSYRATLRQAVELCLERILQIAGGADARSARAAAAAIRVLVVAAYVSSRQIPVHLMTAVLEISPARRACSSQQSWPTARTHPETRSPACWRPRTSSSSTTFQATWRQRRTSPPGSARC